MIAVFGCVASFDVFIPGFGPTSCGKIVCSGRHKQPEFL